ncbi:MAG TPA: NYN domain-containing protein [Tahibacter sp.]|uniref:NYN domain-containing protein n=1 Tax=Tahibacter sp. TaxID=2056211 RepID=UPI002CB43BD0|nr:NYN domain-containing protein [Tahibacter sp.]HSX58931.1 NYN domain-containing protein [Tahibacter sp.]
MDEQKRLAVLIDADNAEPGVIDALLAEVAKYGTASVKRIYGDFTSTLMTQWKKALLRHSITPIQQFAYTSGKNATDSAMIIDAMDILYTGRYDGFCLVSSDSDFTRLAQRLREGGQTVYGFGEKKTPDPFIQACDKFIYTELLRVRATPPKSAAKPASPAKAKPAKGAPSAAKPPAKTTAKETPPAKEAEPAVPALPVDLLQRAIEESSDEHGWANLGAVGNYLTKVQPDFDPRLYGKRKLSDLLRTRAGVFGLEERGPAGGPKATYVRNL